MEANAQAVATPEVASAPAPAPTPTAQSTPTPQYEEGGATDSFTRGKMNTKDIILFAVFLGLGVYGLVFYRQAMKKLDDQVSGDEFDVLAGKVDEMYANLKKALGKNYKTMS